jgi:predicted glycoside hydrolase/deacetylase ChbG (UPF0249 family)
METDNLEIIAHPAMVDDVLPTLSNYVDGRQTEYDFLASQAFSDMLEEL